MNYIPTVAKAIVAGATAFSGAFATAYADQKVDTGEWLIIAIATVIAMSAVWAVPNAKPTEVQAS
jgi:hypothetical protein